LLRHHLLTTTTAAATVTAATAQFRLANCCWSNDKRRIVLEIGCTSYREYLGTHRRSEGQHAALLAAGAREYSDESAHLSCALGVETVLETSDGAVVLLRRSAAVSGNRGQYNGPSGHPEPTNVKSAQPVEEAIARRSLSGDAVQDELFDSIVQVGEGEDGGMGKGKGQGTGKGERKRITLGRSLRVDQHVGE